MRLLTGKYFRQKLFGISPEEVKFDRRGFHRKNTESVRHLETIGTEFLNGYHLAIETKDLSLLEQRLNQTGTMYRGFAFEGAAMGLTLLDYLVPWQKKRLQNFLEGEADHHIYMVYVGIGWAFARIPWLRLNITKNISKYDPLLKWLILDGLGFHEGYFKPEEYFTRQIRLDYLSGYARNAFTQGLGRCLWFVGGTDVRLVAETIGKMPAALHSDLWSGVGLACTYAGGVTDQEIEELKILSSSFSPNLLQGAIFGAAARFRANNVVEHNDSACRILCGISVEQAASIAYSTMEKLPVEKGSSHPAYEIWRQRIGAEIFTGNLSFESV